MARKKKNRGKSESVGCLTLLLLWPFYLLKALFSAFSKGAAQRSHVVAEERRLNHLSHRLPASVSPLRGWTNLGLFEIHGVNPKTGRSNKRMKECLSESDAKAWALSDGLIEPISVHEVPREMATEKQIALCKELGLDSGLNLSKLTKVDVNALIWRHDDGDSRRITDEEWCAACEAGYPVSALCGPTHFRYIMKTGDWRYRED